MGELIAVLSGKGGTGKTSICAAVATALAQYGHRVLCIDCDIGLGNLDISLGVSELSALSFQDICCGSYSLTQALQHPNYPTLFFLTSPVAADAQQVDQTLFHRMLKHARQGFDYVLLDAPAGIDAGFRLAARFADRVLLVAGADPAAIRDASRAGQLLDLMEKPDVRLIVNRVSRKLVKAMSVTVDDIMDDTGLPLIGVVPEDKNVTLAAFFEEPLLRRSPRGAAAACCRIARRLCGHSVPIIL